MRQLTVWEANDGTLHRRRVDAAARDRELRRAKQHTRKEEQDTRSVTSYLFMIAANQHDEEGNYVRRGRLPSNTDVADGLIMHFWESRKGLTFDEAIARAVARCRSLKRRWRDLEWYIDYEARVFTLGKEIGTVDLIDNAVYKAAGLFNC